MGELHGGQHAQLDGPVDVVGGDDLEVLNAHPGVLPGIFLHQALIHVQNLVVGAVADGVDAGLIAVVIGQLDDLIGLLIGEAVLALVAGAVGVVLQHGGAAGAQGAVADNLHAGHVEMVVIQHTGGGGGADIVGFRALGGGEHDEGIEAQLQGAVLIKLLVEVQLMDRDAGVQRGGEAVGEQLLLGQEGCLFQLIIGPGGDDAADDGGSGVGQTAQHLAVLSLQDLSALGIGDWGCPW